MNTVALAALSSLSAIQKLLRDVLKDETYALGTVFIECCHPSHAQSGVNESIFCFWNFGRRDYHMKSVTDNLFEPSFGQHTKRLLWQKSSSLYLSQRPYISAQAFAIGLIYSDPYIYTVVKVETARRGGIEPWSNLGDCVFDVWGRGLTIKPSYPRLKKIGWKVIIIFELCGVSPPLLLLISLDDHTISPSP